MIKSDRQLVAHGMTRVRLPLLEVIEAGLSAATQIDAAVGRTIKLVGNALEAGSVSIPLTTGARVRVLGAGKASLAIAAALEEHLGDVIADGLVVGRRNETHPLRRITVIEADHPLPSHDSVRAGQQLLALAQDLRQDDVLIACFTGGSSALACVPASGVSICEKRHLHDLLLASGATIHEVNTVRKHVSSIKGGRLAKAAQPARIVNLTVSDVAGDPLDAITDPTVEDTTSPEDAVDVLKAYGVWPEVAACVRRHLMSAAAANVTLDGGNPATVILMDGRGVADAMSAKCVSIGYQPHILSCRLVGEARDVGALLAGFAVDSHDFGQPFASPCILLGCGGESTVTLGTGTVGLGGPNQEAAIAAALALTPEHGIAAAFVDTDGSDGGTRFAGAVCDGLTATRAKSRHLDLKAALRAHRAIEALSSLGDLIEIGPTRTNVNDMFALAIGHSVVSPAR